MKGPQFFCRLPLDHLLGIPFRGLRVGPSSQIHQHVQAIGRVKEFLSYLFRPGMPRLCHDKGTPLDNPIFEIISSAVSSETGFPSCVTKK